MSPVFIVIVLALGLRLLGVLGVIEIGSWLEAARLATAMAFIIMGIAHFTPLRHDVVRLVPPSVPKPVLVVAVLGAWQILGGIGLLTAARRIWAVGPDCGAPGRLPASSRGHRGGREDHRRHPGLGLQQDLQALRSGTHRRGGGRRTVRSDSEERFTGRPV